MLSNHASCLRHVCKPKISAHRIHSRLIASRTWKRSKNRNVHIIIAAVGIAAVTGAGLSWWTVPNQSVPKLDLIAPEAVDISEDAWKKETTRILSRHAYSFDVDDVSGISRYDGVQLAASSPCEDRFFHGQFNVPWSQKAQWMTWAVMDGHSGWQTSDLLRRQLLSWVRRALEAARLKTGQPFSDDVLHNAVKQSFLDLDESIIQGVAHLEEGDLSLPAKMKLLPPGLAGSCALLSLYDPELRRLHVACTGDSRAVLGCRTDDGDWEIMPLTVDQTGSSKAEIARLDREHPGEIDDILVLKGRVLGLAVSRAFGDGKWKWSKKLQHDLIKKYYGPPGMRHRYDTPPYLTAEPVITSVAIDPSRSYFLIMATDGLWDFLTNEDAVSLVATWLQKKSGTETYSSVNTSEFAKPPFKFDRITKDTFRFDASRTTLQDDNVAVHLLRKSLGGNVQELVAGRVAVAAPFARKMRDDITIQVVFFNDTIHSSKKRE